jgi:hypothetical protein
MFSIFFILASNRLLQEISTAQTTPVTLPKLGILALPYFINASASRLVDWVTVEVDIDHTAPADLKIMLVSPLGTESDLAMPLSVKTNDVKVGVFCFCLKCFGVEMVKLSVVSHEFSFMELFLFVTSFFSKDDY